MRDSSKHPDNEKRLAYAPVNNLVGDYIRRLRESKKLDPAEVASNIGITTDRVNQFENGKSEIPVSILVAICSLFDVDITDLLAVVRTEIGQSDNLSDSDSQKTLILSIPRSVPDAAGLAREIPELVSGYCQISSERKRRSVQQLIGDYRDI